ncbi:MAG: hypothetical protein ACFFFT_17540, partial [Candidatus Thorarchaeota archaeon]
MAKLVENVNDEGNETGKNDIKEQESKDKPIYLKVSESTRDLIDKYKDKGITISDLIKSAVKSYDEFNSISPEIHGIINKYKEQGETDIKFIERALKYYGDLKSLDRDLWIRARDEMKMMLIGKTTFNQLIHAAELPEDAREKAYQKNVAFDLILWYTGKPLKSLTVEEIINTIAKMWVVANYFYAIDVNKENDEYHVLFKHRQNRRYSEYWLGYF